jgi:hypothetical protein
MGVFDFLKKFSKEKEEIKEIKLDELDGWIDSYSKDMVDNVTSKLESIKEKINKEKKKSKENIGALDKAELRNKNVPERVKQIIDGNRSTYIQKVNMLIEKVNLPGNFDKIIEYCDSFDMDLEFFGKSTLKGHQVLQEFFGEEVRNVAENVRDMGKLVKVAKSILKNAKMERISELKHKIRGTEQKRIRKVEIKDNIQSRTSELRTLKEKIAENISEIKKIKTEAEYKKVIGLIDSKKTLKQNLEELEKELWHSFSVIEPALKKYERITLEKELAGKYLTNSLKTLLKDSELNVVKLLEKMKTSIIDGKIELKDKKMEKILNELDRLNTDYFRGFLRRYNEVKDELSELKSVIEVSTTIKEVERIKEELYNYDDKLKLTKDNIDGMTKEVEGIDMKALKKDLEKSVLGRIGKRITII